MKWLAIVAVIALSGALIWWDASRTSELNAAIDALFEEERKIGAEIEALKAKIKELRERMERGEP